MPGKFTKVLKSQIEYEKTTFNMPCQVDDESVEVEWFHGDVQITPEHPHFEKFEFIDEGRERIIRIKDCPIEFHKTDWKSTTECDSTECTLRVRPMPTFSDQITDVEVHTGQEAVFSCSVDDGEAPFAWFLNGEKLTENEKYSFKSEKATVKQLTIKDCQLIDDGSVSIQMVPTWGPSSNAKLTVIGKGIKNIFSNHQIAPRSFFKNLVK